MRMMKISSNDLVIAVKKLKGFVEKSIILDFTMTPVKGAADKRYLKISASNGISQADIMAKYTGDNEEEKTFFVSDKFIDIVESISNFGTDIELSEDGDLLKVICGTAAVPVGRLTDAMSMKMVSLKETEFLQVMINKTAFADLINHSAYCTGTRPDQPLFNGTVILTPENDGEKRILRSIACVGAAIAGSVTEVAVKADDVFQKYVTEKRHIVAKVASLAQLVHRLESDNIDLFFTDKQVIVRDGFDIYLMATVEGVVPEKITSVVTSRVEKRTHYHIDGSALRKALGVIALTKAPKVEVTFEGETVSLCDAQHGNRVAIQATATIASEKEVVVFATEFLKLLVDAMPNEMELYMPAGSTGMFAEAKGCIAFLLPIKNG